MIKKFSTTVVFALMSLGVANAEIAPTTPATNPELTVAKQKELPKLDPIALATAKLAIELATQTKYTHANGKVQSETRSDGSVGTYVYDRSGQLHGITYSDGRALTVIYDRDGRIDSIMEIGTGQKIVFENKPANTNEKDREIASAFALHKGISVLIDRQKSFSAEPVCRDGSEEPCIVNALEVVVGVAAGPAAAYVACQQEVEAEAALKAEEASRLSHFRTGP